jgi:hypothetical protein
MDCDLSILAKLLVNNEERLTYGNGDLICSFRDGKGKFSVPLESSNWIESGCSLVGLIVPNLFKKNSSC